MKEYKIYTLIDPKTFDVRYVGFTKQKLHKRLASHIYEAKHNLNKNSHKENWIRKLDNEKLKPKIKLLESVNEENWQEREIYWISKIPNLTNINKGGESGNLGKRMSNERILKQCKKVYQYDLYGNFIKEWSSIILASKELNINKNTISNCITKNKGRAGKFQWKLEKFDKISIYYNINNPNKILQISNNFIIKQWNSIDEIKKYYNFKSSNIFKVLNGSRKSAYGYVWKYLGNNNGYE